MKNVHSEQIDSAHLSSGAARLWTSQPLSLSHVQSSENLVYRFGNEDRVGNPSPRFYLRLTHTGHRSYEQLLAELNFVLYLRRVGCRVAVPVPSLQGHLVEPLFQSAEENQPLLHACVFEAAPGARVNSDFGQWDSSLFREWGRSLGAIHAASKQFDPPGVRRLRWDEDDVLARAWDYLPVEETAAHQELERVWNWLERHAKTEEHFGLIHGDLCCANFHFDGHHIAAFDFDDSLYHWFVYDIICALAPMVFHPDRRLFLQWFLEGYQQIHPLSPSWEEELDWFLRLRGLYLFVLNLRDWERPLSEHPKSRFLDVLRQSFERHLRW